MKMIKIVHNKLLRGWFVVGGPHHFPLGGPFASRAEAKAWMNRRKPGFNPVVWAQNNRGE